MLSAFLSRVSRDTRPTVIDPIWTAVVTLSGRYIAPGFLDRVPGRR